MALNTVTDTIELARRIGGTLNVAKVQSVITDANCSSNSANLSNLKSVIRAGGLATRPDNNNLMLQTLDALDQGVVLSLWTNTAFPTTIASAVSVTGATSAYRHNFRG